MTPNKRDLKAYVRFDGTGRIVPGSLVLRRTKPKNGTWKEIEAYECCIPSASCTEPLLLTITPDEGFFEFGMRVASTNTVKGTIEWGDGTSEAFDFTTSGGVTNYVNHIYSTPDYNIKTVKVYFTSTIGFRNLEIGVGDLAGDILSVSGLQGAFAGGNIEEVDADGTSISVLDVSGLPIESLYALNCPNLANLNVSGCTSLIDTQIFGDAFGTLDFSGCTSLQYADISNNSNLTVLSIFDCTSLINLEAGGCAFDLNSVNLALIILDGAGLTNGYIDISGGTSAAPTGPGAIAKTSLQGKGWFVGTN